MEFVLENDFHKVTILDIGATIYKWEVKPLNNRNIVLTYQNKDDYSAPDTSFLGATIGRVANRIKNGVFTLNGKTYQLTKNFDGGLNAGHGGPHGYWQRNFELCHQEKDKLHLMIVSPDDDQGYPGTLILHVIYTLLAQGLNVEYRAKVVDKDTIINITNHSYFNLDGSDSVLDHMLEADFDSFLPYDDNKAVTGEKLSVKGTALDFSAGKSLRDIMFDTYLQDKKTLGLDHCLLFKNEKKLVLKGKELKLTLQTTYPSIQLYGTSFPGEALLLGNQKMKQYHALALEPELPVDAINHPSLGSMTFKKGEEYSHAITYQLELTHE